MIGYKLWPCIDKRPTYLLAKLHYLHRYSPLYRIRAPEDVVIWCPKNTTRPRRTEQISYDDLATSNAEMIKERPSPFSAKKYGNTFLARKKKHLYMFCNHLQRVHRCCFILWTRRWLVSLLVICSFTVLNMYEGRLFIKYSALFANLPFSMRLYFLPPGPAYFNKTPVDTTAWQRTLTLDQVEIFFPAL